MRRMQTLLIILLFFLTALNAYPGKAQETTGDAASVTLHNVVISADGAWMAAEERSDQGDGNVRVWSTDGGVTFSIERGHSPRISGDSRWVSALQKSQHEDSTTAKPKNKRAGQTLVLLDTQDGLRRTFDFVLSYDMTYCSLYLFYLQSPEAKAVEEGPSKDEATQPAKKPATKEHKVGTLHLVHLKDDYRLITMESVARYAAHQTMNYVAYVLHDEETGRDTLHIVGFSPRNTGTNAVYDVENIECLCWARDRRMLGFLDSTETTGNDGKRRVNSALYTWQRDQTLQKLDWGAGFTRVERGESEFTTLHNLVISADGAWVSAEERSNGSDGNVRVWSTEGDNTFTIERGHSPRISRDSRWVSALQRLPLEDSRTTKPKNQRAGQTLVLLDTKDGSQRTFDSVLSYEVASTSAYLVYFQSPETKTDEERHSLNEATNPTTKPAAKERNLGSLHGVYLRGDMVFKIENVAEYATHQTTNHFAYVRDEETGRDTLHIVGIGPGRDRCGSWGHRGFYAGDKINELSWARDTITVGFLNNSETTGKEGDRRVTSALYTWHVKGPSVAGKVTRVDTPK